MSMNTLQYTSQMYGFVAMYKSICRPSLKLFIFSADDNVIASMFGHGLYSGLCASGPHYTDFSQVR
ncbi:hypothetical protein ARMGADRAFT_178825 [Armillaria gallica]|uniref:Uncharacterized protein n=1 Tax=Armillaria gallica TaxID=47427 RepID=A0A2H3DSR0_ARMGA|nr:hypothetical protein ARMGADRAFT_178825 [Armillaria gallica]